MVLPPPPSARKVRKYLSADALMSAFAVFALKDPSLLAFDQRRSDAKLKAFFGIGPIPSDTQLREILDLVDPEDLRAAFGDVFRQLQRGKALEPFEFYAGCYLLSLDGTGYFSSQNIHCSSCQEKVHKNGTVTYEHQRLGAVLVHPDQREVIPLAPEPIQKQDGSTKNDCERNAARRLLRKIRGQHPRLKLIVVEDGLASNGPHVRDLIDCGMHFILGVKPGDHPYLFAQVEMARRQGRSPKLFRKQRNVTAEVSWVYGVPRNESNQELRVDFLEYGEYDADRNCRKHFTSITDLPITLRNAWLFSRGGRARWRIENETCNTLKNQGCHYEHNYGHGQQNLSVVFAMLMRLAFLVDQTQQLCCPLFRAVWEKLGSKRALWDNLRSHCRGRTLWAAPRSMLGLNRDPSPRAAVVQCQHGPRERQSASPFTRSIHSTSPLFPTTEPWICPSDRRWASRDARPASAREFLLTYHRVSQLSDPLMIRHVVTTISVQRSFQTRR